ncbi:MAG: hypothetical protein HXX14_05755 [Bacteroidetes bacterium]|nr:hypothetical protein [Bacteroidota bacterium]
MKSIFCVILLALVGIIGCTKTTTVNATTDLVGTWEWVHTTGGVAKVNETPKTLGYTYKVTYTKEGRFLQYDKDNKLISDQSYFTTGGISVLDSQSHNMITLDSTTNFSYAIREDSLILYQEVYQAYIKTFVKK